MKNLLLSAFSLIGLINHAQVDCVVDVTITQGAEITFCQNDVQELNASDGYVNYFWSGPQAGNQQNFTPIISGTYQVAALDSDGCTSTATIIVNVSPLPEDEITSSEGNPICEATGTALSLSGTHATYEWSNGANSPTIGVTEPGEYSVEFTNNDGCSNTAEIEISSITYNVEDISGTACFGQSHVLQASGGVNYVWSTGQIGPSIHVFTKVTTSYAVTISDQGGSCVEVLTVQVDPKAENEVEYELEDTIYIGYEQSVDLEGPIGFTIYEWSPGNQIIDSTQQYADFTGLQSQMIYLTATHSSGCTYSDSVFMNVINVVQLPNGFSPNGDEINDLFVIPELDSIRGDVIVWNRWGDVVFEKENYQNDWDGTCQSSFCLGKDRLPEGTYFYQLKIDAIVYKSYLTIKL